MSSGLEEIPNLCATKPMKVMGLVGNMSSIMASVGCMAVAIRFGRGSKPSLILLLCCCFCSSVFSGRLFRDVNNRIATR